MAYELHHDPRSSHQRIARYLRTLNEEPILDVGASFGQLGKALVGSGLEIDAIEPDESAAAAAAPFYRSVSVGPIELVDLAPGAYRVIVCADVLEHTADPRAVLRRLQTAAAEGATFVISVPNIGHIAARLIVLSGHFPRHDRGIFDRTHLHFFTQRTARELVESAGLQVEHLWYTPVPLEAAWPRALPNSLREAAMRLQMAASRLRPPLFAYQWVIVARGGSE